MKGRDLSPAEVGAVVAELWGRGVVFEEVDVPGLRTVDGIADVRGPGRRVVL